MDLNSGLGDTMSENKYTIKQADTTISNKVASKPQRPCQHYIDISFNKENEVAFFSYLTL